MSISPTWLQRQVENNPEPPLQHDFVRNVIVGGFDQAVHAAGVGEAAAVTRNARARRGGAYD